MKQEIEDKLPSFEAQASIAQLMPSPIEAYKFKSRIQTELIEPSIYNSVKSNLSGQADWKKVGDVFSVIHTIFIGLSVILAYAAGYFADYAWLSFISGSVGLFSIFMSQFSNYAYNESKKRTASVNKLLNYYNMPSMTDTVVDIDKLIAEKNMKN